MKNLIIFLLVTFSFSSYSQTSQTKFTPELLWKLGRVTPLGISKDGKSAVYSVSTPDVVENKNTSERLIVLPVSTLYW